MSTPEKDPQRVAAGYKAAIHNPNVSTSAKEHAAQELEALQPSGGSQDSAAETHHHNRVVGGYKAALHNGQVGHDAKEHARDVLADDGYVEPEARLPGHEPTLATGASHTNASIEDI